MSVTTQFDLVIIGGGPGGYVAAIRASQLGLKCAVIEKDALGGVCLNWGCIPSKSLIHHAHLYSSIGTLRKMGVTVDTTTFSYEKVFAASRAASSRLSKGVEFLLKKNNVTIIKGSAVFSDSTHVLVNSKDTYSARFILIATGSSPRTIPGFDFDEQMVLSSTGALSLTTLPKSITILGGGAIGIEFSYIFSSFGVEVHCIEMLDQMLPLEDSETVEVVVRALKKKGVQFYPSTKATNWTKDEKGCSITLETSEGVSHVHTEKILVAVGRKPNSENLGLEKIGVKPEAGFIPFGDYYTTVVPTIYAIGDVIRTPLLAHVASAEGELAVEHMVGQAIHKTIDYSAVPSAVYCEPQIASFGMTEKKASLSNIPFSKVVFPYRAAGKSVAIEQTEGIVKLLYNAETKEILGGHIAGAEATEIIHELLLAKKAELLPQDIANTIHAHPSISEAVREAAGMVDNKAIHV
ncbi:MAG: dihydrolipoyl dehydrogenase [Chitinivibrionales bacterium]|nr:dihydrolipoyl dehydrogenase [Chitinivibrionales bacterium]